MAQTVPAGGVFITTRRQAMKHHESSPPSPSRALASKRPMGVMAPQKAAGASPTPAATDGSAETREERIRRHAYDLYEARGRTDGHDLDDWLRAEEAIGGIEAGSRTGDGRAQELPGH